MGQQYLSNGHPRSGADYTAIGCWPSVQDVGLPFDDGLVYGGNKLEVPPSCLLKKIAPFPAAEHVDRQSEPQQIRLQNFPPPLRSSSVTVADFATFSPPVIVDKPGRSCLEERPLGLRSRPLDNTSIEYHLIQRAR